ncbi:hypothetical protein AAG747_18555 [Rapidithrix thailandica]|uniref:Uncharacterized protein n=1 Tax=Rapidithrix thailandica TaxID=413964 RepID=A0AAW9SF81_9BACT
MEETQPALYYEYLFAMDEHTVLVASLILFLASLTQPAFYIDREDKGAWSNSIGLVLTGWMGALMGGGSALAWFANPLIFLAWIFTFKYEIVPVILSVIASALALSFLLFDKVISSEAPVYSKITHYKAGYWFWVLSILVYTIGMVYLRCLV